MLVEAVAFIINQSWQTFLNDKNVCFGLPATIFSKSFSCFCRLLEQVVSLNQPGQYQKFAQA